ncbi:MAG TPA: amidophosphoribosyltransferase [Candidatus Bathyarchaeia archaeon]|nr:amidophosphoribosyltransferase [Candidatus Bathyarchaeia archaeon]
MCGIFGIFSEKPILIGSVLHDGLLGLQHRGQEGTGVMISNGEQPPIHSRRVSTSDSSVRHFFDKTDLSQVMADKCIGHNRYSTAGSKANPENLQPFFRTNRHGNVGIGHNGTLLDTEKHRLALMDRGYSFQSNSDSEIILGYISLSRKPDLVSALIESLSKIRGAYSLLVMNDNKIIAARDPHGFRPLSLATFDYGHVVASETCAFGFIEKRYGVKYFRDVEPGEIVVIKGNDLTSIKPFPQVSPHFCVFELIYFGRPDSKIFGRYGYEFRMALGKKHAEEHPSHATCVIGVPDSANYFADGQAEALRIPNRRALVRSHYTARTFISPDGAKRSNNVRLKLAPILSLIEGEDVSLDDDSVVRGTTSKKTTSMIRRCKPKSITFSVSCPPLVSHCPYGINIKSADELIAHQKSIDDIRHFIGADELHYLSLEAMRSVAGPGYCYGCFTGNYPI